MKTCGHTMGTPKRDAFEAMELFAQLGHNGIEFRCAADGQLDPESYDSDWGERVLAKAQELGFEIACLTAYYKDYVNPAKRDSELAAMRHVIDIAAELRCGRIRSYGGVMPSAQFDHDATWAGTVSGLQELGDYAAAKGVDICIETHIGSLTLSAGETVKMVEDVARDNVGILFDYAWVHYAGKESAAVAVQLCAPHIKHCHVKDWTYVDGERDKRHSALMGEGDVDWPAALAALKKAGYDGYLSDEYEKYWHEHLPEPEAGMKHNLDYVRKAWASA